MATYPPPTDLTTIFNPREFNTQTGDVIDVEFLNANYLKFPIAQGFETLVGTTNQSTTNCFGDVIMNTNKITGCGNPTSAQDVSTKFYVDGRTPVLTASTTFTNSTITTNASGFISSVSTGTVPVASLPYIRGYMGQVSVNTGQATTNFLMSINNVFPSGTTLGFGTWQFNCQMRVKTDNAYSFNCPSCVGNVLFYYTAPLPVPTPVLLTSTNQAGACYYDDLARGVGEQTSNMTFSELITLSQEITAVYIAITAGNTTGSNHPMYIDGWWQCFKVSSNY
jgi:hypothetical protein